LARPKPRSARGNISDVEYRLTPAGHLDLALLATAAEMEDDVPDPVRGGFQTPVNAGPVRPSLRIALLC